MAVALAALAGCHVGPDHTPPAARSLVAADWRQGPDGALLTVAREGLAQWWARLGSAELDALAEKLIAQSLTLGEARERAIQVRARAGVVGAERLPRLDAEAGYLRAGTGADSLNFQGPPPGRDIDVFSLGVGAAWELDLWGRVARLVEGAEADIDVAMEDYRGAAVALLAELALAYVDAHTLGRRLDVLRGNLELQRETLRLARSRLDAGTGTRLDVEQADRELATASARVPELEQARRGAENRIAVLIGERPREGLVAAGAAEPLELPAVLGVGVPADLLERRVDVRRAERALAGAVARVGAAEAERYPRIALAGSLALRSDDLGTLVGGRDAISYSIGPSLVVPLLDGGRIDAEVAFREARVREARLAFERSVLEAIGEVETAATAVVRTRERVAELERAAAAAARAARLARELHDAGTQSLLQVLDAERQKLAADDAVLVARQAAFASTITLYRALGGGFEPAPAAAEPTDGDSR
ncbi:MAG: efflux transporter outer membrane subunit [Planctomycetes bacterium]|nr:efflux transporter outer membrane subunit [Planctomycetota bacterium]